MRSFMQIRNRLYSSFRLSSSTVEFTSNRYSHMKRGPYATLTDKDLTFFEQLLGSKRVITDASEAEGFNTDWLKTCRGQSRCVLKPKIAEEVSTIVRHCYERELAICPQGGNTGLVGGGVPVFDEVILSLSAMNQIHEFDPMSGILHCDSGCVLERLDDHVGKDGYMMPLDLGAKGSCHIGGNIATGAGGIRLLRYGSLHASLIGLQTVQADQNGTIMNCIKPLRKDNTGLHLPHLFLGSEGQLGIITQVSLLTVPRPKSINVAFLALNSFQDCCNLLKRAKSELAEILSSFEFMDEEAMICAQENLKLRNPLPDSQSTSKFYVLVETSGSHADHDSEKLQSFLEKSLEEGDVTDGTVASDTSQMKEIWGLRERLAEALMHDGYTYKQDFSLRLEDYYSLVEETRAHLGSLAKRIIGYGHVGDGNLHLNITSPQYDSRITQKLYPWLYEWVSRKGGSISAEHGVGFAKRPYLHYSQTQPAIQTMKQLKKLFDPKLILNPYKSISPITGVPTN